MIVLDACRDFGCSPDYWEDYLTMDRLAAMNRSRLKRPPLEEFAMGYFGYEPPVTSEPPELPEALPVFEP